MAGKELLHITVSGRIYSCRDNHGWYREAGAIYRLTGPVKAIWLRPGTVPRELCPVCFLTMRRVRVARCCGGAGGAGEVVDHGRNGFLVRYGDVDFLSRYLSGFTSVREMLIRMSPEALKSCRINHTWRETGIKARDFLLEHI